MVEIVHPVKPGATNLTPRQGFWCALGAFVIWGFLPLYFIPLADVPPVEVVCHRIVWAVPFALAIMAVQGRLGEIRPLFHNRHLVMMMTLTACLIAFNWGVYVYSIASNQSSQAALGYYITPLMNVLFGAVLLGERLSRIQLAAVAIAFSAVAIRIIVAGDVPVIGLLLTTSFAVYGYLRKTVDVGPTQGFMMEVLLLSPFALLYLGWLAVTGQGQFGLVASTSALLIGTGALTAVPLILYAFGAKALRFATLGLMQYIAPSMIFVLSFTVFGEAFTWVEGLTFGLIWSALALYSFGFLCPRPAAAAH